MQFDYDYYGTISGSAYTCGMSNTEPSRGLGGSEDEVARLLSREVLPHLSRDVGRFADRSGDHVTCQRTSAFP